MAKDPAFLFYPDNFMTGIMFFSDEQVGKYIRLLCAQHLTGHLQEKDMLKICGTKDEDVWKKFALDSDGKFFNERLENEILKRKNFSASRSLNRKGKIKNLSLSKNKSKKKKSLSSDNDMGNEIDIERENSIEIENEKIIFPFETEIFKAKWKLWLEYRQEINRRYKTVKSEQASLMGLSEFNEKFAIKLIERSIASGWVNLVFPTTKREFESGLSSVEKSIRQAENIKRNILKKLKR